MRASSRSITASWRSTRRSSGRPVLKMPWAGGCARSPPGTKRTGSEIYGQIALTGEAMRFESRADQLQRFYDVYAFRVGQPAERTVAVLFNDISVRKATEHTLAERERQLSTLLKVSDTIRELRDEGEIARAACRLIKDELGAVHCSYGFAYPEEDRVLIVADACDSSGWRPLP